MKILKISETVSRNKIKKIDGFTGERNEIAVHLIGQLGKNDDYQEEISGREILEMAVDKLTQSISCVGGRIVLLECRNEEKLIKFYTANGFNYLQDTEIDGETYKQFEKSVK